MRRRDFHFDLPQHLIAQFPLENRGDSRLLCLDGQSGQYRDQMFRDLPDLVQPGDLMVFNNTRVIPARLFGHKASGGKVEILLERIMDRQKVLAHVRASKSPKAGSVITIENTDIQLEVTGRNHDLFEIQFNSAESIIKVLEQHGHMPLPPYITRQDSEKDQERYQTVYAQRDGAVAAPTAGLHFDKDMIDALKQAGIAMAQVTLHVGAGTFQPVRVDDIAQHQMHREYALVDQQVCQAVQETRRRGGRVIAVGTTSLRALEAASQGGGITAFEGDTDIFIYPGVPIRSVDVLITNFHLPESTLLMLVCAFAGTTHVFNAYQHAIDRQYRFFSYGDAMFIEKS